MRANFTRRLWPLAIVCALLVTRQAQAEQVFDQAKNVGQELMKAMLWLSSLIAACGFMGVGHAFSVGDIERGKSLLRGTLIGTTCIFSAAGMVQFIKAKFGDVSF